MNCLEGEKAFDHNLQWKYNTKTLGRYPNRSISLLACVCVCVSGVDVRVGGGGLYKPFGTRS